MSLKPCKGGRKIERGRLGEERDVDWKKGKIYIYIYIYKCIYVYMYIGRGCLPPQHSVELVGGHL